jgi:hypothetical protein
VFSPCISFNKLVLTTSMHKLLRILRPLLDVRPRGLHPWQPVLDNRDRCQTYLVNPRPTGRFMVVIDIIAL